MLLRTMFRQDDAYFEHVPISPHLKAFPIESEKEIAGCFDRQRISAFGTREFLREVFDAIQQEQQLVSNGMLNAKFENPGLLIICDNTNHRVFAQTDLVGLFPAFWTIHERGFAISDSLFQLHSAFPGETDETGVIEFMRLDYMIGQRTIFRNIKRLQPGESLCFNWDTREIKLKDLSGLWAEKNKYSRKSVISDACELLVESCRPMKETMLMMSGGWDSRTLLAGAIGAGIGNQITLYHHGDTDSREARIVKKQAAMLNLKLSLRQPNASIFGNEFLTQSFDLYENVYHPLWHAAAHVAAESGSGIASVSAGIFGEVIGGHYGPPTLLSGRRKILSTLGYLAGMPALASRYGSTDKDDIRGVTTLLRESPYNIPWYMNDQLWNERFKSINDSVNVDVEKAVDRYISRGIATKESIVEAYLTENRGGQTISSQLRSAGTLKPLLAPFCHREFLGFACSLPYEQKANNSLNRMMIKKLCPKLLDFPTAAILCRASRPILLQETTRAIRRAWEKGLWTMYSRSKGSLPAPNLGWTNFQFLHRTDVMKNLIDSLHSPLWDKKKMKGFTEQYGYNNYHGLQDVMMRIKTLDFFGIT